VVAYHWRELGFNSYDDYLASPLWRGIRQRVYDLRGRVCLKCKKRPGTQIHHTDYELETMRGERIDTLEPICGECHQREHGLDGRKNPKPHRPKPANLPARKKRKSKKQRRKELRGKQQPKKGKGASNPNMSHAKYVAIQEASASPRQPKSPPLTKYCLKCFKLRETRYFDRHPQTGVAVCRFCLGTMRDEPDAGRTPHKKTRRPKKDRSSRRRG
jgi:hypothetical protein